MQVSNRIEERANELGKKRSVEFESRYQRLRSRTPLILLHDKLVLIAATSERVRISAGDAKESLGHTHLLDKDVVVPVRSVLYSYTSSLLQMSRGRVSW